MTVQARTKVIDSDAHVIESEHTWDYLLPHEEQFRPRLVFSPSDPSRQYWVIDGKLRGHRNPTPTLEQLREKSAKTGRDLVSPQESRELGDVRQRLAHMDELGIDVQVLHNTLWIQPVADRPEVDVALCGSWNRWMADVWRQGGGRLRWCAVMPTLDREAAVEQVRYAKENGAVGIAMRPFEAGRRLVDPYFYPIYEEAQRQDLAIAVHIANGHRAFCDLLQSPYDRGGGFSAFRVPTVLECHAVLMSEIPQAFPNLRWGFVEASAQWVPWVVREVRERFHQRGVEPPPDLLRRHNVWVTCQIDDDLPWVLRYAGEDSLIIGTDYGHQDTSSAQDAIRRFREMEGVSSEAKEKVLYHNPATLYGLE